jgi:hypothetical protein
MLNTPTMALCISAANGVAKTTTAEAAGPETLVPGPVRASRTGPGSLSMNRALMAAGLVDRVHVTVFPVYRSERTGPGHPGRGRLRLELIETRTLDGRTQEIIYRPILHV